MTLNTGDLVRYINPYNAPATNHFKHDLGMIISMSNVMSSYDSVHVKRIKREFTYYVFISGKIIGPKYSWELERL